MDQTNEQKLEILAKKVLNKVSVDDTTRQKFGSVVLILMVISIILTLIRVIQECRKNKLYGLSIDDQSKLMQQEIRTVAIKKSLLNQYRLNRIMKKQMPPQDYREYGRQLKEAILEYGSDINTEDTVTIITALNANS